MKMMVLHEIGKRLVIEEQPSPRPESGEVLVRVEACAVCRTDLHVVDGELPNPKLPVVPGHEIVGIVEALGDRVSGATVGTRVGIPWLGHTCGRCPYCLADQENLCDKPLFTGYTRDGGFATHVVADAAFTFPLAGFDDPVAAAPLMCAGLIGWRSLRMAGDGRRIGRSDDRPPERLDAAIIFAPVGALVPAALAAVRKGGRVVCGGIHMSDIPQFRYSLLWEERHVVSVANLTRRDATEFLAIALQAGVKTTTTVYPLARANEALSDLRAGCFQGAAVLVP
jgi:propanol-preferring alcohol dehydrogenase